MVVNLGHNGREEQVHEFPTRSPSDPNHRSRAAVSPHPPLQQYARTRSLRCCRRRRSCYRLRHQGGKFTPTGPRSLRSYPGPCNYQFVYEPHIAPMIRVWMERRKAHHTSQRRTHSPVPAASVYRSPHHSPTWDDPPPIELDAVVASEVDEWRSSANMRRRQTNTVFDDVRFTSDAHPLAIDIPPEDF